MEICFEVYSSFYNRYAKGARIVSWYSGDTANTINDLENAQYDCVQHYYFSPEGQLLWCQNTLLWNDGYKVIFEYNNQGQLILATSHHLNTNRIIALTEFEYDEHGRIFIETMREYENYPMEKDVRSKIHTYKENFEEILTPHDDRGLEVNKYRKFDEHHNMIEENCSWSDGICVESIYDYDDLGNLIKEITKGTYGASETIEYKMLPNGLQEASFHENGGDYSIRLYDYEYDERGNWISNLQTINGFAYGKELRVIEYY